MIGVFDSGFGGLTTLMEMRKVLPDYSYLYLGDNARAPYGSKSQELIYAYTVEGIEHLARRGATLIIIACNTASAEALRRVQQEYLPAHLPNVKVLGVLIPTAEEAVEKSPTKRIGVVATRSTVQSGAYLREISKLCPEAVVIQQACPLLVALVEEGWVDRVETHMIMKKYLRPLKSNNVDALALGCTHFDVLKKDFARYMGNRCAIVSSSSATAPRLVRYLGRHPEIERLLEKKSTIQFLTTDDPERFSDVAGAFLHAKIEATRV